MKYLSLIGLMCSLCFANNFDLALGLQGSSLNQKRGIITYKGYQIIPIYSLNLFTEDLFLAGSALYYKGEISKNISFLTRLNFNSTNDHPLYETEEEESERVRRDETNEIDIILQYNFNHSTYLRFEYSKDIKIHNGSYFDLEARYDFRQNKSPSLFQPGAFVSIGYGDRKHNKYLYGQGASSFGVNNIEYGFTVISPIAINNFWPTIKFSRFEILGDGNRDASYVEEKFGHSLEFLFAKKIW